jgi:AmmeMemoRadiSam system protein B
MKAPDPREIRRSVLAGTWYPGSPAELSQMLDELLAQAGDGNVEGDLLGLISPHAGYIYSGPVAAYAYHQLTGRQFDSVILVGPSHYAWVGSWAINDLTWWETPLGLVPIDHELTDEIDRRVGLNRVRGDREHSLEIQLPFLQRTLGQFAAVPIMMGEQSFEACQTLADGLVSAIRDAGRHVLLLASSDLSHFHSYTEAIRLDTVVKGHVDEFDPAGLAADLEAGHCEACGGGPIVTVMLAGKALGATGARALHYANSGDVTGDRFRVVGYLAGAVYRKPATP